MLNLFQHLTRSVYACEYTLLLLGKMPMYISMTGLGMFVNPPY